MKLTVFALLAGSAVAYQPMTMSITKTGKDFNKKVSGPIVFDRPSPAFPLGGNSCPNTLDGTYIGDVGFDPVGFTALPVSKFFDKFNQDNTMSDLGWLREAELMHGRIAQLAALGFVFPAWFFTLPGNEWTGVDAYSATSPIQALVQAPPAAIAQIVAFMSWLEFRRINIIRLEGSNHIPGDLKWGQGEGRWNPFGFDYTPAEYELKQEQEILHCRLAMFGALGLLLQNINSGVGIGEQLGRTFTAPEWYAKAGYYFPDGI